MEQIQAHQQVIYQADSNVAQVLKKAKQNVQQMCSHHLNKPVRVQLQNGQYYEGVIANVDQNYLYLSVPELRSSSCTSCTDRQPPYGYSPYGYQPYGYPGYGGYGYNPYVGSYASNVILPLVLFDLLAISLL